MSVIIRLQNLPWSANAMDIRTFFRGLSIPEGGVHIVGGEQGDAFIAFSTDEDARQAMMNDGGKIKEIQVKLLLSSRSEMHKVIETARQSVSFLQAVVPPVIPSTQPALLPPSISGLLTQSMKLPMQSQSFPPIIEPIPSEVNITDVEKDMKRSRDIKSSDKKSTRSRSRSRDTRDRKDKRDRSRSRDRSRDRSRRRRDRSRSRDRRDRRRDKKERSRSRDRDRSKESDDAKSLRRDNKKSDMPNEDLNIIAPLQQAVNTPKMKEGLLGDFPHNNFGMERGIRPVMPIGGNRPPFVPRINQGSNWVNEMHVNNVPGVPIAGAPIMQMNNNHMNPRPGLQGNNIHQSRFNDNVEQMHRLQMLDERRNPNAFQNMEGRNFNTRNNRQHFNDSFNPNNARFQTNNGQEGPSGYHDSRSRFTKDPNARGLCIKMQNLASSTRYGCVRRFFFGNYISNQGLKLINDENGKRTGVAYVKFFKYESKQNALCKNGQILNGKPVTIVHLDDEEFDSAVDSYRPNKDNDDSGDEGDLQKNLVIAENDDDNIDEYKVLLLEDMPTFALEHDIIKMFSDYSLLSIRLLPAKGIRKHYVAYVEFVNATDAKAALNNRSKHLIGHKIIKVSPCSERDFEAAKASELYQSDSVENSIEPDEGYKKNEIPPMSRDPRQRRSENRQDDLGSFNKALKPPYNHNVRFPWRGGGNSAPMIPNNHHCERDHHGPLLMRPNEFSQPFVESPKMDCAFLRGLPLRTTDRDILDFFSDIGVIPTKTHLMWTTQGQPSGDCFCEFIDPEEAIAAVSKNGCKLGNNDVSIELVTKKVVDEALGVLPSEKTYSRGGFRGARAAWAPRRGRGGIPPFRNGAPSRFPPPNNNDFNSENMAEGFGMPGCVLSLENVPFRAGIDEILQFFGNFNLTQNNVIRRFNDKGHPTGDVRVCLRNPQEAQHALQQLNKKCIRDRMITITVL